MDTNVWLVMMSFDASDSPSNTKMMSVIVDVVVDAIVEHTFDIERCEEIRILLKSLKSSNMNIYSSITI